jgi:rubrerythrin
VKPEQVLLAAAQAVEHYEISRYGTLKAWAEKLGMTEAAELLDETLEEEKKTDEALTEIAEQAVNAEADRESKNKRAEFTKGAKFTMVSGAGARVQEREREDPLRREWSH